MANMSTNIETCSLRRDIFDFSLQPLNHLNETDGKQVLYVLYQVCDFRADPSADVANSGARIKLRKYP